MCCHLVSVQVVLGTKRSLSLWHISSHRHDETAIICVREGLFLLLSVDSVCPARPCPQLSSAAPQCWVDRSLLSCGRKKAFVRRGFSVKVVNKDIVLIWRKYRACFRCRCCPGSRQSTVSLMLSPHIAVFVVIFVVLSLCQRVCRQEVQWVEVC